MAFGIETLLISLAFLLPGFLTSKLIGAKTPALGRQPSAFDESLESLLRSVYIHLVIAPVVLAIVWFIFVQGDQILLKRIYGEGLQVYYEARPFQASIILLGWLIGAFLLASLFGYKWDPLDSILSRITKNAGTVSEDPFYPLRQLVTEARKHGYKDCQLWIQARLKNGYTYRGELTFVGYRQDGKSRELMLANVNFFPYPVQADDQPYTPPKLYDFVFLDVANCESLEMIYTKSSST